MNIFYFISVILFLFRSRTSTDPTSSMSTDTPDFSTTGSAHVRLNRAIEIVIDSIQSLEGAVNNFDQLVFGLIYGRLSTRNEYENIEVNTRHWKIYIHINRFFI